VPLEVTVDRFAQEDLLRSVLLNGERFDRVALVLAEVQRYEVLASD
jgi:hypothetical protein